MKTLIAIPCMDMIESSFVECLLKMRIVGEAEVRFLKGSLVYDARNQIMQYALKKGGFDYILWLDSDMTFEPDLMERMMDSIGDKPMLTGLCFGRRPPFKPCIFKRLEVKQDGLGVEPIAENWYDYPRDSLFQVEGCGFACVLQRIDMLDAMSVFGIPFFPIAGLGEDLAFCWRAKKLDFEIWCDSRIRLGHLMRMSMEEGLRDQMIKPGTREEPQLTGPNGPDSPLPEIRSPAADTL